MGREWRVPRKGIRPDLGRELGEPTLTQNKAFASTKIKSAEKSRFQLQERGTNTLAHAQSIRRTSDATVVDHPWDASNSVDAIASHHFEEFMIGNAPTACALGAANRPTHGGRSDRCARLRASRPPSCSARVRRPVRGMPTPGIGRDHGPAKLQPKSSLTHHAYLQTEVAQGAAQVVLDGDSLRLQ
jgi:hypothetical protein